MGFSLMMKTLACLTLLASLVVGQDIASTIATLQASQPGILVTGALSNVNSYQSKAKQSALNNLSNPTALQIGNYYALACIYYATNGVGNPRTEELIKSAPIPNWITENNWLTSNYCNWWGITCSAGNVIAIDLHENNLYGTWPPEVVLLKDQLQHIELFNNFFHHSTDPKWIAEMTELKFLYFGTTSWEYPGVPTYINGARKLIEIDMSNTFWTGGPIRPEAFADLTALEYLDMGNNIWDTTDQTEIPSTITNLVSLENLYLDDCIFTPNRPDLNFLVGMPALFEVWMDFTQFEGGLPTGLGSISTLTSFSCTYCNLSGNIPSELGNTNIDRLWLYANNLDGTIPDELGTGLNRLQFLYLEGNNLRGAVPESICDRRTNNQPIGGLLSEFGVDCDVSCDGECCTCCGLDCGNFESPTPAPISPPTSVPVLCFSGDCEVQVENKGSVKMIDLAIGDAVKVAHNKYEPVYSFGHRNDEASAEFLQIVTEGNRKPLEISKDHMVNIEGGRSVPASMVNMGDMLVTASGNLVAVKIIRNVVRKGIYAPFTESGSIIVNGIAASNYVAYQDSEFLKLAGFETPFTYQWLAHTFNSVHRLAGMMGFGGETYSETGLSQWVALPHKFASWLLGQNAAVALAILVPSFVLFGFVSLVEALVKSPIFLATLVVGVATLFLAHRSVSVKMTKKM